MYGWVGGVCVCVCVCVCEEEQEGGEGVGISFYKDMLQSVVVMALVNKGLRGVQYTYRNLFRARL